VRRRVDIVVFDVGGTLVDETRMWHACADLLGVEPGRLLAELDAVLTERRHHREVFQRLVPGFDVVRIDRELSYRVEARDLYPDAMPALGKLVAAGFRVAVAANQPEDTERALAACGLPVDFALSSARMGIAKPDPAFFAAVAAACAVPAGRIAYVGDRLDNDVLPARAAGMLGVFLPRGPWGRIHATWPEARQASIHIADLLDLPAVLAAPGVAASSSLLQTDRESHPR